MDCRDQPGNDDEIYIDARGYFSKWAKPSKVAASMRSAKT